MTANSEQPRFLKDREHDVEAALAVLTDPESPADNAVGDRASPANDDLNAERLSLKAYLDSTWYEGAAFGKWVRDAAHRANIDAQLPTSANPKTTT